MPTDDDAVFGDLLRRHRLAVGLTQEMLAERAGLSARAISDLERGIKRWPYRDTVCRLAEALPIVGLERERLLAAARRPSRARANRATAPSAVGMLPRPLTSLVGRTREIGQIIDALSGDVRLLTVTGPGGVGKTRVAIEAAAKLLSESADDVVYVDLTPLMDASLVLPTIAAALALQEKGDRPVLETLIAALERRHTLLLLDNCEHVLAAAPELDRLLSRAPRLAILATSRARLALRAEQEIMLPPLDVPNPASNPGLAELAANDSVTLFLSRARSFNPDLKLTCENAKAVADICVHLDGLPLAIELAAARTKLFSLSALAQRLERRLPVLRGGSRDLPERQRTMRETIAWSYHLLPPAGQMLFRRLAVFSGGFTLEAAERAVADPSVMPNLLDDISDLVDSSLLRQDGVETEDRFGMLETLREFGLEELERHGETEAARRRHGEWFFNLAKQAEPELLGTEQARWLHRLAVDYDNLRAALTWAAELPDDTLLQFAAALIRFWRFRSLPIEGQSWLERALAQGTNAPVPVQARAWLGAGIMSSMRRDFERARDCHSRSLSLYRECNDVWGIANGTFHLGDALDGLGDKTQAAVLYAESVELFRAVGSLAEASLPLKDLGRLAREAGDYQQARRLLEEALELCRQSRFDWGAAEVLLNLGQVASAECDWKSAATLLIDSMNLYQTNGDQLGLASGLQSLASVAAECGLAEQSATLLSAAFVRFDELGLGEKLRDEIAPFEHTAVDGGVSDKIRVAAWATGRTLSSPQALAAAQSVVSLITGRNA